MNICILTQPLERNYGGLLQAYALQRVLKDLGHQVTTLRFKPLYDQYNSKLELYWKMLWRLGSKMKGNKGIVRINPDRQWKEYRENNRALETFIAKNIHCLDADCPLDLPKLPEFDAFLVGSDQVWRPVFSPCLPNFYLDFLGDAPVRRIAYAASFGTDTWDASEEMTETIRPLAQRFDTISVREQSGVDLCRSHLGIEVSLMPDPTLLLRREDYLDLCHDTSFRYNSQAYIATHFLDPTPLSDKLVSAFADKHRLPVVKLNNFNWKTGAETVEHWITGIANARYIITDSFHGTVFSLIFQKDFITFNNGWRGSSRFDTLLDTFSLKHRLINPETVAELIIPPIVKEDISRVLSFQREKGIGFLTEATR